MPGISKGPLFQKFIEQTVKPEDRPSENLEILKKIEQFIEGHPDAINTLSREESKKLQSNLDCFQKDPSCVETIHKINTVIDLAWEGKFTKAIDLIKKSPGSFFSTLDGYTNLSPDKLKKLLSSAVNQYARPDSWDILVQNIPRYKISDESIRREIAKIIAAQDGWAVAKYFKYFDIQDDASRIEIAKIAAAQDGKAVAEHIQKFNIQDENALIEIAKIAAKQNGWWLAVYIQNFNIQDENALIEIAKIAAKQNGHGLAVHIQNFNIQNENVLIELAKMIAAQDGEAVAEHIQKFNIQDENALIEIAKIAAKQNGWGLAEHIQNFNIQNENVLIELAKIAAKQDGWGLAMHIQNFNIQDENVLIELAKMIAAQNGEAVAEHIQDFKIQDENARREIAKIAVTSSPLTILPKLDNFFKDPSNFKDNPEYKLLLLKALAYGLSQEGVNALTDFEGYQKFAPLLKNKLSDAENNKILETMDAISFFKECIDRFENAIPIKFQELSPCQKALTYRNKQTAYQLIGTFISEADNSAYQTAYQSLAGTDVTPRLPSILPAKWIREANAKTETAQNLSDFFKNFKKKLKNQDTGLMQIYLLTALSLDKCKDILAERKLALLSNVCNQPKGQLQKVQKGLTYLYAFSMRGQAEILNALDLTDPALSFQAAFEKMLAEDPLIDSTGIDNFTTLYRESFEHTRVPLALEIYKAKISTLNDAPINDTLKRLIRSVVLKNFKEERFRTDINPHLFYLETQAKKYLDAWKTLEFSAQVGAPSSEAPKESFSFFDFFNTKLRDQHWNKNGKDLLPELTAYLNNPTSTPPPGVALLCKELIDSTSLSKEEQIEKVENILESLEAPGFERLELENDLRGLITTLRSNAKASSNETVLLSKDWQDLFLSGTEVPGSCQRIDGEPDFNKCLLAYCMDGKNSMIAVKNQEGKILARSMLRLLWNENGTKPALFLERLYPDPCPAERQEAIIKGATQCAKQLNCDLFTQWGRYSEASGATLKSLGSSCPYEYVDAARGVMENGVFEIRNMGIVYAASSEGPA